MTDIIELICNNDFEGVIKAIENGAKVNLQNTSGNTALHIAVHIGKIKMAELLIEKGADVNLQNRLGNTALMMAADRNDIKTTKILLENKANANAKNNDGKTALDIAIDYAICLNDDIMTFDYDNEENLIDERKCNQEIIDLLNLAKSS